MDSLTPQPEGPEVPDAPLSKRVSVVIVSLQRVESLRRSLELLGDTHQVIVVDNGSSDGAGTLDAEFPGVQYSRLPKNFGLTKALNIGLRAIEGEYILCLHDDTRITADAVSRLADFLEAHPEAGAVCPLLTDDSGQPVPQARALPTPANPDPELVPPTAIGEEILVDCVSGAAIMFRAFFLRALRTIDERYGTYGGTVEICAQMRRSGKKVVILRGVTAVHEGLRSPVPANIIDADRAAGTAAFLGKHHGFASGLIYRLKTGLSAFFTLRFSLLAGAISGQKIDGSG
jgi:N-acetylglucosaminyl-diphospho-decaprenol L-rhamnosyltransferase